MGEGAKRSLAGLVDAADEVDALGTEEVKYKRVVRVTGGQLLHALAVESRELDILVDAPLCDGEKR